MSTVSSTLQSTPPPSIDRWRDVLPLLGAYLIGAWTFLQAVDWVLGRAGLSPHWATLLFVVFVGVLPALLVYLRARHRIDAGGVRPWERNTFLANGVVLLAVLFVGFGGTDLGATTTKVTFDDHDGSEMVVAVAKPEFRRPVPIFPAVPTDGVLGTSRLDTAAAAFGLGFPAYVGFRLEQSPFLLPVERKRSLLRIDEPRSRTEKIAEASGYPRAEVYVDGTYAIERVDGGDGSQQPTYVLTPQVRDVATGNLRESRTFRGTDPITVADSAASYVLEHVGLDPHEARRTPRTSLREAWTSNADAFLGYLELEGGQLNGRVVEALQQDTTFAYAALGLANQYHRFALLPAQRTELYAQALRHRRRLPKRTQVAILADERLNANDLVRAERLIEIQLELDPADATLYETLSLVRLQQHDFEGHATAVVGAVDAEPTADGEFSAVEVLLAVGRDAEAFARAERAAQRDPEAPAAQLALATAYLHRGEFAQARRIVDDLVLLRPELEPYVGGLGRAAAYLERSPNKFEPDPSLVGTYRFSPQSTLKLMVELAERFHYSVVPTQSLHFEYPIGRDTFIMSTPGQGFRLIYRRDDAGDVYAATITQNLRSTEFYTYEITRPDSLFDRAEHLLLTGALEEGRRGMRAYLTKYPSRHYMPVPRTYLAYADATPPEDIRRDMARVIGRYTGTNGSFELVGGEGGDYLRAISLSAYDTGALLPLGEGVYTILGGGAVGHWQFRFEGAEGEQYQRMRRFDYDEATAEWVASENVYRRVAQ